MNLRFIDWIWHVRGSLPLAPGQSNNDTLDKLASLFHQTGTSHRRSNNTLTFSKKDQAAQDKMSVFDSGNLQIERRGTDFILRYNLTSRALLFCFLAPLLFLGIAQATISISKYDKPLHEDSKKHPAMALNPVDRALGAPAPDKPKKNKKGKAGEDDDKKLKPTAAYVMAAIFAALYVIGRILEGRLVKGLFKKRLLEV